MKTCLKSIAMIALLSTSHANAGNQTKSNNAQQAYIHSLATFLPTFAKNASLIWPGLTVNAMPLVVTFDAEKNDRSVYAFHFIPSNTAWQKITTEQTPIYFMPDDNIGAHAFTPTLQAPYFMLESQPAMKFSPSFYALDDQYQLDHAILAGTYYVYYELNNSPYAKAKLASIAKPYPAHTGFNQAEGLSLLLLESMALNTYLEKHDEEALKDFAAIYQYRLQRIDQQTQAFDSAYPALPCAFYVMLKASLNDDEITEKLLSDFPEHNTEYDNFANPQHLPDYLDALTFNQTAASFALDRVQPDWKMAVETNNVTPIDLLQKHYATDNAAMADRIEKAKIRYDYDKLFHTLDNDLKPYLQKIETLQAQYQQNNGVELVIHLPAHDYLLVNYEADGGAYNIDSQIKIHHKTSTLKNISDVLSLDARRLNLAYHNKQLDNFLDMTSSHHTLTIKLPQDAKITADTTNDIVSHFVSKTQSMTIHKFNVLASGDQSFTLKLSIPGSTGQLKVTDNKIHIFRSPDETLSVSSGVKSSLKL